MNILFVCTGNTCRSVMAEYFLKKLLKDENIAGIDVSSAGVSALPHYRIYGDLKKVIEEEGINVDSHQATQVDSKGIGNADLILVMEQRHKDIIMDMVPSASDKVFLLKEFAGEKGDLDIPDPIGQPEEIYRSVFNEIKTYMKKILPKFRENSHG